MGSDRPRRRVSDMLNDDDGPPASEDRVHDALAKILTLDTTPPELARRLHLTSVGQEEAVRRCAVHLRHHLLRIRTGFTQGSRCQPIPKHNRLLIGPTGTGKSLLATAMASVSGLPFHSEEHSRNQL